MWETFYLSAIINAGLLRDLTLGVSHDNIHLCSFNDFARGLKFLRSEVSRSEFSRSEVSRSEFSRHPFCT